MCFFHGRGFGFSRPTNLLGIGRHLLDNVECRVADVGLSHSLASVLPVAVLGPLERGLILHNRLNVLDKCPTCAVGRDFAWSTQAIPHIAQNRSQSLQKYLREKKSQLCENAHVDMCHVHPPAS